MSHTQHLADLCVLLVREAYGELTARIFALLLRRGRLSIATIKQHTGLTGRQIRHGLVVLIQQNLLYHNTDQETNSTYYEANEDSAYFLLRSGRMLETIQERYGVDARDIVQNLLLLGHTKIADLAEAYESKNRSSNGHTNGTNGNEENGHGIDKPHEDKKSAINLDGILARLLDDGFVEPVVESMFTSPADAYIQAEKEIISTSDSGGSKSAKATTEINRTVVNSLQKAYEERSWKHGNMKRYITASQPNGTDKRRKLANGKFTATKPGSYEDIKLNPDLVVRINYERFTVALRTSALVAVAKNDIGDVTSQVYGELLRLLEDKIPHCRLYNGDNDVGEDDSSRPTITTSTLVQALSSDIPVASGIGQASSNKMLNHAVNMNGIRKRGGESADEFEEDIVTPKSRSTKVKFDVRDSEIHSDNQQARLTHLKDHLLLLTGHNHNLLKKLSNDGLGEFTVLFKNVAEYMRETELDTYIASAFGKEGLRISHILRKHGKLDEKQVQKIALMKQGEVRKTLLRMQMGGFADIQEVPRDTLRTPSRTIFLWWFDKERITNMLLDRTYKSIARCLQVLETERYKDRVVLALANRSDVRGNEHEMLPEDHLVKLNAFTEKEDRLTTQINRLDQLVGIFKEF